VNRCEGALPARSSPAMRHLVGKLGTVLITLGIQLRELEQPREQMAFDGMRRKEHPEEGERRMYYRIAIQVDAQPTWKWQSTALSSLNSLLQWLQVYRAFPQERLRIFSSTGSVERAAREREPGTLVHFGPGHTVSAREEDRSTRSDEWSSNRWVTSTRANDLHPCRNLAISRCKLHELAGQAKRSTRTRSGWRS
jgi:hypothetical protein